MSKTATSLYRDAQKAADIVSRLEQAGIARSDISVYSDASDNITDDLESMGVPRSDAHAYAEGVRRGGTLVAVECDDDEAQRVIGILDGEGTLDLDEQQASWRSEGWRGYGAAATGSAAGSGTGSGLSGALAGSSATAETAAGMAGYRSGSTNTDQAMAQQRSGGERDEIIPVAEEELHVGKRDVSHGRVRIQSRVVERPVQEQVTLRQETVEVERRPASGTMQTGAISGDPFQERTIEVEEHGEEAVVSKEARVKEELVVHKDVEQRTETVSDTVRRTEVDVEDERGKRATGTTDAGGSKRG